MIKLRLIRLLGDAKKYIGMQVLSQWISLIAQIVIIFSIANIIELVGISTITMKDAMLDVILIAVGILIRFLCDIWATKMGYLASADVKRILRNNIYEKLVRLGASYRESISTASVIQMSMEGVEQLEIYFGRYLPQLFYSLIAPITLFIVLSFINVRVALVLIICVPLIPVSIVAVQKIAKKLLSKYWGKYTGLGDSFGENLSGLTTLKIYEADDYKTKVMDEEAENFRKITMKVLKMQLNSISVMDIIAYGGAAVGIIMAVSAFINKEVSLSGALVFILLSAEFFIPLRLLGSFFHVAMNGMAASDKIFSLLDMDEKNKGILNIDSNNMDIKLSDVNFSYNDERQILNNVNIELNKGSFVSLVGESGCGKSTIAGIICGKNRGYQGDIKIGEIPLNEISELSLKANITLINHDSYIFADTLRNNLLMAKPNATDEELYEALKTVNLYDFVKDSKDGLDMKIIENAGNLSGGQRQRLALARGILHDTEIYIFDEATSNIDAESEAIIMDAVHKLAKTKTVLLISHRLFNVMDSDKIYMIDSGNIIESGSHSELMNINGKYKELFDSQRALENYRRDN